MKPGQLTHFRVAVTNRRRKVCSGSILPQSTNSVPACEPFGKTKGLKTQESLHRQSTTTVEYEAPPDLHECTPRSYHGDMDKRLGSVEWDGIGRFGKEMVTLTPRLCIDSILWSRSQPFSLQACQARLQATGGVPWE